MVPVIESREHWTSQGLRSMKPSTHLQVVLVPILVDTHMTVNPVIHMGLDAMRQLFMCSHACMRVGGTSTPRSVAPSSNPSIALPNQDAEYVSHIALDIGGSLIKLVYFSPDTSTDPSASSYSNNNNASTTALVQAGGNLNGSSSRGGELQS